MKKTVLILGLILVGAFLTALLTMNAFGAEQVRYVKGGGSGDGLSASTAMGDLAEAIEDIAETGGVIVICGDYDITTSVNHIEGANAKKTDFAEPEHTGSITITSKYGNEDYTASTITVGADNHYFLSGNSTFENLTFNCSKSFMFAARYNELTIGENVDTSTATNGTYVVGGYNNNDIACRDENGVNYNGEESRDVTINLLSGSYLYVIGFNRYINTSLGVVNNTGTCTLNLSGDALIEKLVCGWYENQETSGGHFIVNIEDSATVMNMYSDNKRTATCGLESITANVKSADTIIPFVIEIGEGVVNTTLNYLASLEADLVPFFPVFKSINAYQTAAEFPSGQEQNETVTSETTTAIATETTAQATDQTTAATTADTSEDTATQTSDIIGIITITTFAAVLAMVLIAVYHNKQNA